MDLTPEGDNRYHKHEGLIGDVLKEEVALEPRAGRRVGLAHPDWQKKGAKEKEEGQDAEDLESESELLSDLAHVAGGVLSHVGLLALPHHHVAEDWQTGQDGEGDHPDKEDIEGEEPVEDPLVWC